MDPEIIIPIVVFSALAFVLYTWITRTQATKQKQLATLQTLAETNSEVSNEVLEALMPTHRAENDFRRGVLLLGIGLPLAIVLYELGGDAWLLSLFPIVVGAIYIAFSKRGKK